MTLILISLPTDILILVARNLPAPDLGKLACTSRFFKAFVDEYGWPGYLRANPRPSYSLTEARTSWSSRARAYFDTLTDAAWARSEFVARPLSRPWKGKLQPTLAINSSRLFLSAGHTVYSYKFGSARGERQTPSLIPEDPCKITPPPGTHRDITALAATGGDGSNGKLYIGFQDGSLEQLTIGEPSEGGPSPLTLPRSRIDPAGRHMDLVESLSASHDLLLSLTSNGYATLSLMDSAIPSSSSVELNIRSWVCHLVPHATGQYAAFGTTSFMPLSVHSITGDGLRPYPMAVLQPKFSTVHRPSSAVYGITHAPPSSPWGSSPQILVSGWFDGYVRCYDLRSASRSCDQETSSSDPIPLRPALEVYDPLSYEPIYSVSCGGGYSSYIAAGCARHSVVSFWDVRAAKKGWSVHAPGNDSSPVYSVILESSRLFGATQSRPFVYDFGPGVTSNTYPNLPRGVDGLKHKEGHSSPGFYVTTYHHYSTYDH